MNDKTFGYVAWSNDDVADQHIYGIGQTIDEAREDARKHGWTDDIDELCIDALTEDAYWDLYDNGGDDLEDGYRMVASVGLNQNLYDVSPYRIRRYNATLLVYDREDNEVATVVGGRHGHVSVSGDDAEKYADIILALEQDGYEIRYR